MSDIDLLFVDLMSTLNLVDMNSNCFGLTNQVTLWVFFIFYNLVWHILNNIL